MGHSQSITPTSSLLAPKMCFSSLQIFGEVCNLLLPNTKTELDETYKWVQFFGQRNGIANRHGLLYAEIRRWVNFNIIYYHMILWKRRKSDGRRNLKWIKIKLIQYTKQMVTNCCSKYWPKKNIIFNNWEQATLRPYREPEAHPLRLKATKLFRQLLNQQSQPLPPSTAIYSQLSPQRTLQWSHQVRKSFRGYPSSAA